jgi:hypothetical protein
MRATGGLGCVPCPVSARCRTRVRVRVGLRTIVGGSWVQGRIVGQGPDPEGLLLFVAVCAVACHDSGLATVYRWLLERPASPS